MKTRFVRILIATLMVTMLSTGLSLPAMAATDPSIPGESITATEDSGIMPLADVIVVKFREYEGRKQFRRWNETQNRWVDPYWIDLN